MKKKSPTKKRRGRRRKSELEDATEDETLLLEGESETDDFDDADDTPLDDEDEE